MAAGTKRLTRLATTSDQRRWEIFPYLMQHLRTCRPKDVPQHAERVIVAVSAAQSTEFICVLKGRMVDLSASQAARIKRVIKEVEANP
jgi:hypothetical protein